MAAGQPTFRLIQLENDDGTALSYANLAAFQAAGFAIGSFRNRAGTAYATQPTCTLADVGAGLHRVEISAEPLGEWYAAITQPAGLYCSALALRGLGEPYSNSGLAALIVSTLGAPATGASGAGVGSPASGILDDWIEEDTYVCRDIQIPAAALLKVGAASIDEVGLTITAAAKQPYPTKQSGDAQEIVLTPAVQDAGTRLISLTAAWDVGYALGTAETRAYVVDITLEKGGVKTTARQDRLTLKWQADAR